MHWNEQKKILKTKLLLLMLIIHSLNSTHAQSVLSKQVGIAAPLDEMCIGGLSGKWVTVKDGSGNEYFRSVVRPTISFRVGGALGTHSVCVTDEQGREKRVLSFLVDAQTRIDDGGYYQAMFDLLLRGMKPDGSDSTVITWNGKSYHIFVPWVLDNYQTMEGMKYFKGFGEEFVDLMREAQRKDGMIWSFVAYMPNVDYFLTRDKFSGYSTKIGDKYFVRQPVENHPEYLYVNTIYSCWKADGNDAWMKKNLESAERALEYTMNDPARWSQRFQLLKRVYTIDSWDFAVEDEYMPDLGMTNSMIIDPVKSKFGIFFGDNTGYITACYQLAEMLANDGRMEESLKYRRRGDDISMRLNKLAWNGHFFTHFIEDDSTVKRNLGVDEHTQIAQSNCYSLNRNISPAQSRAIIETYLTLSKNLPVGSPGEWYSIYPPFQRGFEKHDAIWQYMNGGVGGHVAGELSRGAFENGYEAYAIDILNRLFELGKKYNNKISFSYTGSLSPPPAPPGFTFLDISKFANMDIWNEESGGSIPWMLSKKKGDDLRNLPVGIQDFNHIRFKVIDPLTNDHKAVVAVSRRNGFPSSIEIPVHDTASCIYFLHTSGKPSSENVAGEVHFVFEDGTTRSNYMIMEKNLTYWWFSQLKTDYSGIAWYGKNQVSEGVGLSWCAINNPSPGKKISKIILNAAADDCIYAVLAISLADKPHYVPVNPVSFGGPDNWAAATAMAAMVEGLAGVKDSPGTQAYSKPAIGPRWAFTRSDSVNVTVRYAASKGYVAYRMVHDRVGKRLLLDVTGSGKNMQCHILMPEKINAPALVFVDDKSIVFHTSVEGHSTYADFEMSNHQPAKIIIRY